MPPRVQRLGLGYSGRSSDIRRDQIGLKFASDGISPWGTPASKALVPIDVPQWFPVPGFQRLWREGFVSGALPGDSFLVKFHH